MDKYSSYIVTFIDALGTKQRSTDFQKSLGISHAFNQARNMIQEIEISKQFQGFEIKTVRFSDTLVIFSTLPNKFPTTKKKIFSTITDYHMSLFCLNLLNIALIQSILCMNNIMSRGGITIGDAFCDIENDNYFGPAFNRAYELENSYAIYPRVIIDPKIVLDDNIFSRISIEMGRLNQLFKKLTNYPLGFSTDIDGMYYVDYLNQVKSMKLQKGDYSLFPQSVYENKVNEVINNFRNEHQGFIDEGEKGLRHINILQKYSWLMKKIEEKSLA